MLHPFISHIYHVDHKINSNSKSPNSLIVFLLILYAASIKVNLN